MSGARKAVHRLNNRLSAFRPGELAGAELPRWPRDAFDPTPLERMTVPPLGKAQLVCAHWPECCCDGDCDGAEIEAEPKERRRFMAVGLTVVAIVVVALAWLGLR